MSHFIYKTEAIILSEMPSGEDSRLYFLLTKDLGLVLAEARGVRLLKSKLRYNLYLFASVQTELVRGKSIWRVVNVYPNGSGTTFVSSNMNIFARLSQLVRRLVHGEEENRKLFDEIFYARNLLLKSKLSKEEAIGLELAVVARILFSLGYFGGKEKYDQILNNELNTRIVPASPSFRRELALNINEALKESQL
ncbi:MAG: recombination protein O N-terminal domain-containing protein [Patescibacteria group bacterium]